MAIDRRTALGMTGLGLGAMALGTHAQAMTPMLPGQSADRLKTYMLVRGALDDRLVTSWASARYYGVIDDQIQPLFNVRSVVFARFRPAVGGGFEAINAEIAWFTDPESGLALTSWRNPYTGRDVKVPGGGTPPSKSIIRSDLTLELARPVPGLNLTHEVLPFEQRGDMLYISERTQAVAMIPGAARPYRYNECLTYHAPLAALHAPGVMQVTSEVSYTNVCGWRPWLEMGEHPGHLMATGYGRQGASIDSIPDEWNAATLARRPEVLKDPAALLAPLWDVKN